MGRGLIFKVLNLPFPDCPFAWCSWLVFICLLACCPEQITEMPLTAPLATGYRPVLRVSQDSLLSLSPSWWPRCHFYTRSYSYRGSITEKLTTFLSRCKNQNKLGYDVVNKQVPSISILNQQRLISSSACLVLGSPGARVQMKVHVPTICLNIWKL